MKIRVLTWILLVAFTAVALGAVETLWTQERLADKTVRLHVVANSDSEEDQRQKLAVRDAVLPVIGELTARCADAVQAREVLAAHLPQIQAAAQTASGGREVTASLTNEAFPTRYYDTFTLPAGTYPSLRIRIGAAQGHNWWCVVFPSLCFAATSDALERCAAVGGFDESETELITGGEETYTIRFKVFEWVQSLIEYLKR
ncbi:MAG: stage II sporulation protein R [Oscillospiraceae bacterium]|nr:stage II sporulation protein R [Oscillospiraceae bacterium]